MGICAPVGFPTLHTLSVYPEKKVVHVNIFGNNSGKESVLLHLQPEEKRINEEDAEDHQLWYKNKKLSPEIEDLWHKAASFLGKRAYADWPYFKEVQVIGVSTVAGRMYMNGGSQVVQNIGGPEGWIRDALVIHEHFYSKKAVDIGPVQVMAHVRALSGMYEGADGSRNKQFLDHEQAVPLQLCFPNRPTKTLDIRTEERDAPSAEIRFPIGSQVIYIGNQYYGSLGNIESIDNQNNEIR